LVTIGEVLASEEAQTARPRAEVLRRADGLELVGEFEDSGFKDPQHLARRRDGQVVQLTELLYAVVAAADGRRDVHDVAAIVSERTGRPVTGENVSYLADENLRPLGVLALADGETAEVDKRPPVMALRCRKPLLSERTVNAGARLFTWLHAPPVKYVVLATVALFDFWLFFLHGIAGGLRSAIYSPELLLAVLGSVVVATLFHEFGHASACRYSGARPGVMGVGLYLVWPAFYCDVTDAYRLDRSGRLRTDLGGVYFNLIFALLAGAVFFATGEEAALLAAVLMHITVLQQLLPLLRFDGYYVLTDLTGVPDILSRIKPIFRSLVRGRDREPQVAVLKPWVRVVVTLYLALLIPALVFMFTWMIMGTPRILATVHDSLGLQLDQIKAGADPAAIAVGAVRILMLVLPLAAMSLSLSRTGRMAGRGLFRWSRGSAPRRVAVVAGTAALVVAVGYVLWPNGDYEPIRDGERGTVGEALSAMAEMPSGRPSFTTEYASAYEAVPTDREIEHARSEQEGATLPADEGRRDGVLPQSDASEQLDDEDESGADDGDQPDSGTVEPDSSGTTTQPGTSTTTQPAPSGSTTTDPAPTGTSPTPSEPAPTATETTPTTTETTPTTTEPAPSTSEPAPDTSGSTDTTVSPDALGTSTSTVTPDTTTTTVP
jgi:putative peptide zinc metalloprotease protein